MTAGAVCDQTDPYQSAGGMAHSIQPLREAILRGSLSNTHALYTKWMLNVQGLIAQDHALPIIDGCQSINGCNAMQQLFFFSPKKMWVFTPCWRSLPVNSDSEESGWHGALTRWYKLTHVGLTCKSAFLSVFLARKKPPVSAPIPMSLHMNFNCVLGFCCAHKHTNCKIWLCGAIPQFGRKMNN